MGPRRVAIELAEVLGRAHALEAVADSRERASQARRATARLLLAAVDAGWRISELAPVVGLKRTTAQRRVATARRIGVTTAGIQVEPPPASAPRRTEITGTPVRDQEWLTSGEAADLVGVDRQSSAGGRLGCCRTLGTSLMVGRSTYVRMSFRSHTDLDGATVASG